MASLQLVKSSPSTLSISTQYSYHRKFSCFCWESNSRLRYSRILIHTRRSRIFCKIQESDSQSSGEEPPESLFMKELKRRGMKPTSLLEEKNRSIEGDDQMKLEGDGPSSRRNAVRTDSGKNIFNQREQSMALNSEGLEGLIPRAKLLLTLGGTFFLAFWPLILVTVASFAALYLYFGTSFVHDGSGSRVSSPQYMDPYALLEEERIYQKAPNLN